MHLGLVASAFGLGANLGLLPGPVQFLLLSESTSGGALRGLKIAGGAFLLFLAWDALRETLRLRNAPAESMDASPRAARTPFLRGMLALVLNPGAWIFLATTASALFATAVDRGGRP